MRTIMTSRRLRSASLAFAVTLMLSIVFVAPHLQRASAQDTVTISIVDFAFSPSSMTITAGTTVTWVNQGAAVHTATSDTGAFDTGQIAPGQSASVTFDTPGTYTYYCAIHPNMTATIVVTSAGAAEPTATSGGTTQMPTTGSGSGISSPTIGSVALLAGLASGLLLLGFVIHRRAA